MAFEDNADAFRSWLYLEQGLTHESAGSYVSYCRRVERDLVLSLDSTVRTQQGLESVLRQIETTIPSRKSAGNLQSAVKRYSEFLNRSLRSKSAQGDKSGVASAQALQDFPAFVDRILRDWLAPGLALAVARDGELVLS